MGPTFPKVEIEKIKTSTTQWVLQAYGACQFNGWPDVYVEAQTIQTDEVMDSRIAHIENVYTGARGGYRGCGARGGGRIRGFGRGAYRRGRAAPEGIPPNIVSA